MCARGGDFTVVLRGSHSWHHPTSNSLTDPRAVALGRAAVHLRARRAWGGDQLLQGLHVFVAARQARAQPPPRGGAAAVPVPAPRSRRRVQEPRVLLAGRAGGALAHARARAAVGVRALRARRLHARLCAGEGGEGSRGSGGNQCRALSSNFLLLPRPRSDSPQRSYLMRHVRSLHEAPPQPQQQPLQHVAVALPPVPGGVHLDDGGGGADFLDGALGHSL